MVDNSNLSVGFQLVPNLAPKHLQNLIVVMYIIIISIINDLGRSPSAMEKKTTANGLSSFSWLRRAVADQRAKSYLPGKPPRF